MSTGLIIALIVAFVVVDALIMWRVFGRMRRNSPRLAERDMTTRSSVDDLYMQQQAAGVGTLMGVTAGDPMPPPPPDTLGEREPTAAAEPGAEPTPTPDASPGASDDSGWSLGGGWSDSSGGDSGGGDSGGGDSGGGGSSD